MFKKWIVATAVACLGCAVSLTAFASGALDQIKSSKQLTIGYRESSVPFSFLDQSQKPVGFSMDLCSQIVDHLKKSLGVPDLNVKYLPVTSANRIPLIQNGTVTIECGGTANSLDRQKQVGFSVATFVSHTKWLTKKGSGINSAQDLKGKTVVVTQGSNAVQFVKQISDKDGLGLSIVQAHDHAESMLMLQSGRAAAFMEDDILLAAKKAEASNPDQYAFLPDSYNTLYYGLMVPKDDPELKALVDKTLSEMMASGEFVRIYKKWFQTSIPPNNVNLNFPISDDLKERIAHPSDKVPA